ncbi:MAG TPA: MBL fold metallo-hydrolase [Acidimicrobiales bacterium]
MTTTTVTLTGTGVPHPAPGRAGPGVLVRHGETALQFDAGRGTVLRLAEAGTDTHQLDALFVTHVHSDHVVDLADVVMTRWLQGTLHPAGPLPLFTVAGQATAFAGRMLDPFVDDIALRVEHVQEHGPALDIRPFSLPASPVELWRSDDGSVVVEATGVHHEPVREAVAYRITTHAGVVVVSGDTRVCDEVRELSAGADVLVHEACRLSIMKELIRGTPFEQIFDYHADTIALGGLAESAGVGHLVLTHLIPPPAGADDEQAFADDVRRGGYSGPLTVGHDLFTVELPGDDQ